MWIISKMPAQVDVGVNEKLPNLNDFMNKSTVHNYHASSRGFYWKRSFLRWVIQRKSRRTHLHGQSHQSIATANLYSICDNPENARRILPRTNYLCSQGVTAECDQSRRRTQWTVHVQLHLATQTKAGDGKLNTRCSMRSSWHCRHLCKAVLSITFFDHDDANFCKDQIQMAARRLPLRCSHIIFKG